MAVLATASGRQKSSQGFAKENIIITGSIPGIDW